MVAAVSMVTGGGVTNVTETAARDPTRKGQTHTHTAHAHRNNCLRACPCELRDNCPEHRSHGTVPFCTTCNAAAVCIKIIAHVFYLGP